MSGHWPEAGLSVAPVRPEAFREVASSATRLSLDDLLRLHGNASGAVLLLVLSVLCVIPVYGVGTALSLAILLMAWHWRRLIAGDDGASASLLPHRLSHLQLDETWSARCLHGLAWLYGLAGRWLRSRWSVLHHRHTHVWWSLWIALMGVLIFLPLPFGNVLPSLSLVLLSLGWMFRDGVALLLSTVVGSGAVAFAWLSVHLLLELARTAWGWLFGA